MFEDPTNCVSIPHNYRSIPDLLRDDISRDFGVHLQIQTNALIAVLRCENHY